MVSEVAWSANMAHLRGKLRVTEVQLRRSIPSPPDVVDRKCICLVSEFAMAR